jgi:hypothetical protein
MGRFRPCLGRTACADDGSRCRTCGRSLEEIERTRTLVDGLAELALGMDYDNPEVFADYVARRIVKKVRHERERAEAGAWR